MVAEHGTQGLAVFRVERGVDDNVNGRVEHDQAVAHLDYDVVVGLGDFFGKLTCWIDNMMHSKHNFSSEKQVFWREK